MSRVLITGGASPLGAAVAKRLLADPAYDVRVSDTRPAPRWMREGCEMHRGDLRIASQALAAARGCSHVVHLASFEFERDAQDATAGAAQSASADLVPRGEDEQSHTLLEHETALHAAVVRAALGRRVERLVYVSSSLVFERAELFPTPEDHLERCLAPRSARGFGQLIGERLCVAAHEEHDLAYAICRPFGAYGAASRPEPNPPATSGPQATTNGGGGANRGPATSSAPASDLTELIDQALTGQGSLELFGAGERTTTPTHVEDLADGIVAALDLPAAVNQDFNLGAARELAIAEVAQIAWRARGGQTEELALKYLPPRAVDVERSVPSVQKAQALLGWRARIEVEDGIAAIAQLARERGARAAAMAGADG